jgi:prepilin-type N-terminal cleavage/methylation domain-containing protein
MQDAIRRRLKGEDKGFSLVELLIVVVIMGILAAIAIPVFTSQRGRAEDQKTKSDLESIQKELSAYFTEDGTKVPVIWIVGGSGAAITSTDRQYHIAPDQTTPTANDEATLIGRVSPKVGFVTSNNGGTIQTGATGSAKVTTLAGTGSPTRLDWCVSLGNADGREKIYRVSAQAGIEQGACSTSTTP